MIFIFQSVVSQTQTEVFDVKTRRGRGKDSVLKGIVFEDLELEGVKAPFVVNSFYFCDPDGRTEYVGTKEALPVDERTPKIESIEFRNIVCHNAHYCGAYIYGLPEQKDRASCI